MTWQLLELRHQLLLVGHRGVFRHDLSKFIPIDGFLLNQQIDQAIDDWPDYPT
jgi:hypothetical protein